MTTTTRGRWVSVPDAVGILGLSERTVRRRVAAGDMTSRMSDGRREVWVESEQAPAGQATGTPTTDHEVVEILADQADRQIQLAAGAANMAERIADDARSDARRARRSAVVGWSMAGVLLVGGAVAGVWLSWHLSGVTTERDMLASTRDTLADEIEGIRGEAVRHATEAAQIAGERDGERRRADALAEQLDALKAAQAAEDAWHAPLVLQDD